MTKLGKLMVLMLPSNYGNEEDDERKAPKINNPKCDKAQGCG
jgi:hypothetical protein